MNGGEATSHVAVARGDPPPSFASGTTTPTPTPVDLEIVWPVTARWTVAVLLLVASLLIGWNSWLRHPAATRSSHLEANQGLSPKAARGARPEDGDTLFRVDLNKADHAQILQLPGVGESLARKIESYREASGGFHDVAELSNVPGIGPAIFARLKAHITVGDSPPERVVEPQPRNSAQVRKSVDSTKPINMNSAPMAELQRLPGIGPTIASRIIAVRQVKPFRDIADLRRVSGIGPKTLEKLRPFVVVDEEK